MENVEHARMTLGYNDYNDSHFNTCFFCGYSTSSPKWQLQCNASVDFLSQVHHAHYISSIGARLSIILCLITMSHVFVEKGRNKHPFKRWNLPKNPDCTKLNKCLLWSYKSAAILSTKQEARKILNTEIHNLTKCYLTDIRHEYFVHAFRGVKETWMVGICPVTLIK